MFGGYDDDESGVIAKDEFSDVSDDMGHDDMGHDDMGDGGLFDIWAGNLWWKRLLDSRFHTPGRWRVAVAREQPGFGRPGGRPGFSPCASTRWT